MIQQRHTYSNYSLLVKKEFVSSFACDSSRHSENTNKSLSLKELCFFEFKRLMILKCFAKVLD